MKTVIGKNAERLNLNMIKENEGRNMLNQKEKSITSEKELTFDDFEDVKEDVKSQSSFLSKPSSNTRNNLNFVQNPNISENFKKRKMSEDVRSHFSKKYEENRINFEDLASQYSSSSKQSLKVEKKDTILPSKISYQQNEEEKILESQNHSQSKVATKEIEKKSPTPPKIEKEKTSTNKSSSQKRSEKNHNNFNNDQENLRKLHESKQQAMPFAYDDLSSYFRDGV